MKNLLIIEENLIEAHTLTNYICKRISDIRLYNIASTGKEAINIINEEIVDIIILDLNLPDVTGVDVINYIAKNKIEKYKNSIIIFTNEMQLLREIHRSEYVFNYCTKINSANYIISSIKEMIEKNKKDSYNFFIKEKIKLELEKLHFNFSYIGTKYLYELIYECYSKNKLYDINLRKEIYPILSKKYNKAIATIKSDIFHATSIMYCETEENILSSYFEYEIIEKPKVKDIVNIVLQKIYENTEETKLEEIK